jgi:signal transduction histidine kinase
MIPPAAPTVLVLAPAGRDAFLAASIIEEAGLGTSICRTLDELTARLDSAVAAVVAEEALAGRAMAGLLEWVGAQPPWSDFPFLLLARRGHEAQQGRTAGRLAAELRNATLLERPFRPATLASGTRSAVAARQRQYEARDAYLAAAGAAERLRFALDAGGLGAWEFDAEAGSFSASEQCRAVFGRPPQARFEFEDLVASVDPEDAPGLRSALCSAVNGAGDVAVEFRTIWPDRSRHWAELRGRVDVRAGRRALITGVSRDTTTRREAEEHLRRHREELEALVAERTRELKETNERLRQAAEERDEAEAALLHAQKLDAIGQLTGGLAHDFNNLLQAVLASFDMIRRRGDDRAQLERLVAAGTEAARRGATLTAQLLAFSRKQKLDLAPIPAAPLVAGMRDLLARAVGPEVKLHFDLQDEAGAALADATQLELAVLNLAINARDAMPRGGTLTVSVRPHHAALGPDMAAGRYVAIAVSDTGEGMPPEVAARAFEPFFTTKGVGKGTGLGLSQVYGIARQSGGTARIRSALGEGTTVTVFLPVAAGPVPAPGFRDGEAIPEALATATAGALVLIIDDDPAVRQALAGWLTTLGYRVAEAADGRAGLAELERLSPDALLVDYAMPGLTGTEVAKAARQRRPDLPVVLATGYSSDASLGSLPTLRKPFRIEELADVLGRVITRSASRAAVGQ